MRFTSSRSNISIACEHVMSICRLCRHGLELLLDFGPQPLCNRFLADRSAPEKRYPLRLGQCPACGLLQLVDPLPAAILKPARPMTYNEPEWHLDQVADRIVALPGICREANICGLTYKDTSTIAWLRHRGYRNAVSLDIRHDLGVLDAAAGVETFADRISEGVLRERPGHRERYQVVIARHIVEHARDLHGFVAGLRDLLAPGGYLIFEVPDFTASVRGGNYATIWEEHVVYFTKTTFPAGLRQLGLDLPEVGTYPSALEDLLVGVTRAAEPGHDSWAVDVPEELRQGRQYAAMFADVRQAWKQALAGERAAGRPVALLGAGHLAIMFLNLLELHHDIDFVVDDDPAKIGSHLPGSRLPVHASSELHQRTAGLCLMTVAPESQAKVLARHHRFVERGGRLASIFPGDESALEWLRGSWRHPSAGEGV
jgi:hypothetical protein